MGGFALPIPRAAEDPGDFRDLSKELGGLFGPPDNQRLNAVLGSNAALPMNAAPLQTQKVSLTAAAAIPVIGAVVGGLKEILPFIQGGGKKKQVAAGIVRAGEASLRQQAARYVEQPSAVETVAAELQALPADVASSEQISVQTLRMFGLALRMAVEADKRTTQGFAQSVLVVCGDLDTAMDTLTKPDQD